MLGISVFRLSFYMTLETSVTASQMLNRITGVQECDETADAGSNAAGL